MPGLSLAWEAVVTVGERQDLGDSPLGLRFVIPILGGAFRGGPSMPDFRGDIEPGGADRQLLRSDGIRELIAEYDMRADDGSVISIRNRVIVDADAAPERYAFSRIEASAPAGRWGWLNRRMFLGTLQSDQPNMGYVVIRSWLVEMI
jgi:hypothetical protein